VTAAYVAAGTTATAAASDAAAYEANPTFLITNLSVRGDGSFDAPILMDKVVLGF
jgi:hypothetical protein